MFKIILIIGVIIYALSPYDIIPDFLFGWGWMDDIVIVGLLWRYLNRTIQRTNQSHSKTDQQSSYQRKSKSTQTSSTPNPYRILGVSNNATRDEIKKAYKKLAIQYHPDKVHHLGDEFKDLAEKRFKEIQEAYNILTQNK
jgi:uncharacterized membrane protein YkvA (DUF1232 family)